LSVSPKRTRLLTAETFWELVKSGGLRLVRSDLDEGISYFGEGEIAGGGISTIDIRSPNEQPITTIHEIRRQIRAVPGHESADVSSLEGPEPSVMELAATTGAADAA
jgi:hypothetical protein